MNEATRTASMPWEYSYRPGSGPWHTPEERAEHLAEAERRTRCVFDYCSRYCSEKFDAPLCDEHVLQVWSLVQAQHANSVARSQARLAEERKAATRDERMSAPGTIYYLRVGDHIKVGYASHLESRLAAYPPTAELLATHPGTLRDEQALHKRFTTHRVAGREWYAPATPILEHIDTIIAHHGKPKRPEPLQVAPKQPRPVQMRRRSGPTGYRVA